MTWDDQFRQVADKYVMSKFGSSRDLHTAMLLEIAELRVDKAALLEALEAMSEMWVSVCSAVGHDPEHMTQYVRAIAAIQSAKGKA